MSEVYIHEPTTNGAAVLRTTHGDLQVELWATECPKACRNFCQLILEGYYNGTDFHRIIKDFIVQGGDKTGTGDGCESIYGQPYADEIHPRLKFRYRGMMGIASAGKGTKTNGSQFFITLNRAPSLDGKHTLFGKVVGDTVYNLIRLSEAQVDKNDKPLDPAPRILRAELTWDPFGDLEPRCVPAPPVAEAKPEEPHRRAPVRNKRVLSFANDDEDEDTATAAKGKSAHELLSDPKLSKEGAYPSQPSRKRRTEDDEEPVAASGSRQKPVRKSKEEEEEDDDSDDDEDADEDGGAVQLEKARGRQALMASLKRDIADLNAGPSAAPVRQKAPKTALEEQRKGYIARGKAKWESKAQKKLKAVDLNSRLKSFAERVRSLKADEEEDGEEKPKEKPDKKDVGTFAAIWEEGVEESNNDWLSGKGLKFHVTADKAFKLESLKARENLEIFDPLLVKGNDEQLAEVRKKRSEKLRPQFRHKESTKKW